MDCQGQLTLLYAVRSGQKSNTCTSMILSCKLKNDQINGNREKVVTFKARSLCSQLLLNLEELQTHPSINSCPSYLPKMKTKSIQKQHFSRCKSAWTRLSKTVNSAERSKFELIRTLMVVLTTCNNEEVPIKTKAIEC